MKDIKKALERAEGRVVPEPTEAESVDGMADDAYTAATMMRKTDERDETVAGETKLRTPYRVLQADYDNFRLQSGARSRKAVSVDGAFRTLRTQVLDAVKKENIRIVGVTSPTAGVGKTVTAIQLSMACARRADQVVTLADFDYRRPAIAEYLSASNFKSTTAYYRGKDPISDYLTQNEDGNLRYLLTREPTDMSAEYLASPRMDEALRSLTRDRNSIVIADLPPLIGCDDTMAMMPKLDGVILVFGSGDHGYGMLDQVREMVPMEKVIGAVLNRVPNVDTKYKYTYNVAT